MFTFTDDNGLHNHEVSVPGRPYNATKPVTCPACINRLNTVMAAWLDKLTKRENLPEGFWDNYKFSWSQ